MEKELFIGVDVSKDHLDIYLSNNKSKKIKNKDKSIQTYLKSIKELRISLVVLEATGGYEQRLVKALHESGIAVSVVNPRYTKNFAKSLGRNAKNDLLDSQILCIYAEKIKPKATKASSKQVLELKSLILRREQLVSNLSAEKNRLKAPTGNEATKECISEAINFFKLQIKKINQQIKNAIGQHDDFSNKDKLLQQVSGVGKVCSATLIALLPELGQINRKQIAALVGLAPYDNDSGKSYGKRSIYGGRTSVRNILYMATLTAIRNNPCIRHFFKRLVQKGKNGKVAITACMRKLLTALNAMIRDNLSWNNDRYLTQKSI